jgi:hypothetical protein
MTACLVLVAASAATPGVPVDAPGARERDRPSAGNRLVPRGMDIVRELPDVHQAASSVENLDGSGPVIPTVFTGDIPATVLDSYRHARDLIDKARPGCHLPLELLEAIGKVETNHARYGLVDAKGTALQPILGPILDGNGFAVIPDTDGGRLDGDPAWDRAVGSMQFLPSTWAVWSADGNGDHRTDPDNVYDASLTAARYLCAADRDLGTPEGLSEAIFSYNHSTSYRNLVLAWMSTYTNRTTVVPNVTALNGEAPVRTVALTRPANTGSPQGNAPTPPATAPATTPTRPPTTTTSPPPPATQLPATRPSQPPTGPPPAGPVPGLVCGVSGLVGTVTGLVGGLLGAPTGGVRSPACDNPTAAPAGE